VRPLLPESKEQRSRSKSLHINTFRLPLFEIEGIALQDPPWRTRKTQELFVYLLQHHGQLIQKSDLLRILWKKRNLRESSALLYTTVYNMRQALQPFQDYITLHNVEKAYYLELNNVEVVSVLWEEALQKLGHVNHATIEKYVEIMSLNQRPYFEKINNTWIQSERARLEQLWHKAAENIACYYEGINKEEEVHYWRRSVLQRNTIN